MTISASEFTQVPIIFFDTALCGDIAGGACRLTLAAGVPNADSGGRGVFVAHLRFTVEGLVNLKSEIDRLSLAVAKPQGDVN